MQIKFNFNNFARVCHSLERASGIRRRRWRLWLALSNNDVISLRSLRCVGWKPRFTLLSFCQTYIKLTCFVFQSSSSSSSFTLKHDSAVPSKRVRKCDRCERDYKVRRLQWWPCRKLKMIMMKKIEVQVKMQFSLYFQHLASKCGCSYWHRSTVVRFSVLVW